VSIGGPYDTSDVRQILARLHPPGQAPEPGSVVIPKRLVEKASGFLDRLIEEHFTKRGLPADVKDPTKSHYGVATQENTLTWGNLVDMTFPGNEPTFPFPPQPQQIVQVMRPHPTAHAVLTVFSLGGGWNGENQTTFRVFYTVGVGQAKSTILRTFILTAPQLAAANNTTPIVDVVTWPFQSLQAKADVSLSINNNVEHGLNVAVFVAPVVW